MRFNGSIFETWIPSVQGASNAASNADRIKRVEIPSVGNESKSDRLEATLVLENRKFPTVFSKDKLGLLLMVMDEGGTKTVLVMQRKGTTPEHNLPSASLAHSFFDWAQGEWILDREETLRAIGLMIPDEEKRKLVLEKVRAGFAPHIESDRLKFLPDSFESWQVGKAGVPVPADVTSFGEITSSPLEKPGASSSHDVLEVTLKLGMKRFPDAAPDLRPSSFAKTKEGLLQWKFEYQGEKRLTLYRRAKPEDENP
jgi:hypothetical protein